MNQNPYLWILKADPERYIRTRPATLAVFLKAAEGLLAVWFALPLLGWLRELLPPLLRGGVPPLPDALLPVYRYLPFVGSRAERIILTAFLLVLFVLLLALCAEGAALVWLRLAISGARFVKLLCSIIWTAILLLILLIAAFAANSSLSSGVRPSVLLAAGVCILPLVLLFFYYRDAVRIMGAIDFEIRFGYKEMDVSLPKLLRNSFLLALLCLAAAAALFFLSRRGTIRMPDPLLWEIGFALMAVKYFNIYSACRIYLRCHR